jgi:hypothetical protein
LRLILEQIGNIHPDEEKMTIRDHTPRPQPDIETIPFSTAEEAWFWFIQAQQARTDGARFSVGQGLVARPCEPLDILGALNGLYRTRRLLMDHLLVLRHYGRRLMPPDRWRPKEMRAFGLWAEALARLEPVLIRKGIVAAPSLVEAAE